MIAARLESEKQKRSEMGFEILLTRWTTLYTAPDGWTNWRPTIRRQVSSSVIEVSFRTPIRFQYVSSHALPGRQRIHPDTWPAHESAIQNGHYGFRGATFTTLSGRPHRTPRTHLDTGPQLRSSDPFWCSGEPGVRGMRRPMTAPKALFLVRQSSEASAVTIFSRVVVDAQRHQVGLWGRRYGWISLHPF